MADIRYILSRSQKSDDACPKLSSSSHFHNWHICCIITCLAFPGYWGFQKRKCRYKSENGKGGREKWEDDVENDCRLHVPTYTLNPLVNDRAYDRPHRPTQYLPDLVCSIISPYRHIKIPHRKKKRILLLRHTPLHAPLISHEL